eukprot:15067995-Alexandrium_andersonii.AAC.1
MCLGEPISGSSEDALLSTSGSPRAPFAILRILTRLPPEPSATHWSSLEGSPEPPRVVSKLSGAQRSALEHCSTLPELAPDPSGYFINSLQSPPDLSGA